MTSTPYTTTHVSQSECNTAQDCGMRWFAQWYLGLRHAGPEGPPARVGSLGHACLGAHVLALADPETFSGPPDFYAAMLTEARKRHYLAADADWCDASQDLLDHANLAHQAAHTLITSPEFDVRRPVMLDGRPLVEQRLHATWEQLARGAGLVLPDALRRALASHRLGMEGTPDVVHYGNAAVADLDAPVYLDDYKMRTRPVDGTPADNVVADPQGAFYKMLLAALGADGNGRREVVFRQVNVYAGRWMTLEDFIDPGSPYVVSSGLPTRDEKRMPGMVRAEVWREAWRVLEERRRIATADNPKGPRLPTTSEYHEANRFIEDLSYRKAVQVSRWRLDHTVCLEVVRDMLAAVAMRLAQVDAGITPGRHLRTWKQAPCVRPFGCDVSSPCLASLGSNNAEATLREHLGAGRFRLDVLPAVGDHDDAPEAA